MSGSDRMRLFELPLWTRGPVPGVRRPAPRWGLVLSSALCAAGTGCFDGERAPARSGAPAAGGREAFVEVAGDLGIECIHENGARGDRHVLETTSGGAAWLDHDGDGWLDLYVVNGNERSAGGGAGKTRNFLWRNLSGRRFVDVTDAAGAGDSGYGIGAAVGDYDNDGLSDLYVTNFGPNVLYHNEGGGRFRDVTREAGVTAPEWSASATFLDIDRDGLLDLYVANYLQYDVSVRCESGGIPVYCGPRAFPGAADRLFRNRGDGTYEDVSARAGIARAGRFEGKSLGVIACDYDGDGDSDLYVACDQVPNLLFQNDGHGSFTEVALLANVAYSAEGASQAGMGVDAGDFDLDGREDIVVTNFSDERNALYRNEGGGTFSEISQPSGLGGPSLPVLGFGIVAIDYDLDSDPDIYAGNGHVLDNVATVRSGMEFAQPDQLFENLNGRGFRDVSERSGGWFRRRGVTRTVATADFDEDGDEDIAVVHSGARLALLRNETVGAHWIALKLEGRQSSRDAYGAKVRVAFRRGGERHVRSFECRSGRSYAAACDPRVRVGLGPTGSAVAVEEVEVVWPSGIRQVVRGLSLDRVHHVLEPQRKGE